IRMRLSARVYGWTFAAAVPIRTVWGNAINCTAALGAIYNYTRARIRREPLKWLKTSHAYPTRSALLGARRGLGEILVGSGYITTPQLDYALATPPHGRRIGEHLVALRAISEESLYEALSLQQALPAVHLEPHDIAVAIARILPRWLVAQW